MSPEIIIFLSKRARLEKEIYQLKIVEGKSCRLHLSIYAYRCLVQIYLDIRRRRIRKRSIVRSTMTMTPTVGRTTATTNDRCNNNNNAAAVAAARVAAANAANNSGSENNSDGGDSPEAERLLEQQQPQQPNGEVANKSGEGEDERRSSGEKVALRVRYEAAENGNQKVREVLFICT